MKSINQSIALITLGITVVITGTILFGHGYRKDFPVVLEAHAEGGSLGIDQTCYGKNVSPQINIPKLPRGTKTYAVLMYRSDLPKEKPDANKYGAYWMVWNIEPQFKTIAAGNRPSGTTGRTFMGEFGYDGPCPEPGQTIAVRLTVFAFDGVLMDLSSAASFMEVKKTLTEQSRSRYDEHFTFTAPEKIKK